MITIYKITSPTGRIYIGQTVNLKLRLRDYKSKAYKVKEKTKILNSIRKHGFDKHTFEIIEVVDVSLGDDREIYWIDFYKSYNTKKGMNLTLGGKRTPGIKGKKHYKAKIVYQWDFNGVLVKKWDCIKDVQDAHGWNSNIIGNSIRNKCSVYGFVWSFTNKSPGVYRSQRIKQ